MATTTSTLRLVAQLPDGTGTYAAYSPGTVVPALWHRVDVRAHCHLHQAEWTEALTRWHGELMAVVEDATPWAWLLSGSRMHVWHKSVRPLLFALGLLAHFREQPGGEVLAVGCPQEVGEYVRELSAGSISVIDGRTAEGGMRADLRRTLRRMTQIVSILRRVRPVRLDRAPATGVDLLVFSIGLDAGVLRQRGDHFFGRVLDRTAIRTHWLYQLHGSSGRRGIEGAVRDSGRQFSFDHRLGCWWDVVQATRTSAHIRRRMEGLAESIPAIHIGGAVSQIFSRRFFTELFIEASPLSELFLCLVMKRLLAALSPSAVCYPYEEKGLERALLMACATASHPVNSIGFAHAAYNSGHLYLRESSTGRSRQPRPSVIAAAGSGFGPWLAAQCGRRDVVVTVGSPRRMETVAGKRIRRAGAPLHVLFLVGLPAELSELAEWIDRCHELFEQCEVTIRPNPQEWHSEQRAALTRLRSRGTASFTLASSALLDAQIVAADVVLFCATSAVAEAIRRGRVVVYVDLSDLWMTDPLHGDAATVGVPRCATPVELKQVLGSIAAMDSAEYERIVATQQVAAERIYAPFELNRFDALVRGAGPS